MTKAIVRDAIYRRRRFQSETIELCVRWYLTYRLSYRDLVEMMAEHGISVSHSTILRWVQRYVPEFEKRWDRYARRVHSSWRMDETAVSVRGGAHYLYRAVDKHGKTVESLLCADRSESAARAFFSKALETHQPRQRPRKVNLDGNAASHRALRLLRQENPEWRSVVIRSCRYLNNIVEQDHRAIKSRCAPMLALKSFRTAAVTLAGVELAHRIRKRQFSFGRIGPRRFSSLKHLWARALARRDAETDRRKPSVCGSGRKPEGTCRRFLFAVTRVIAPPGSELTPSRLHNDRGYFVLGRSKNNSVYEKPVPPLFAPSYLSALLAIALLPTAASSVYDFNGGLARAPVTPEHPVDVGPQPPLVPYDHRFSLAF